MKILIVYYSRTETTKKVAQYLSESLKCEVEEITDQSGKYKPGIIGFFYAGRNSVLNEETEISGQKSDPSSYDLVIIGTPVWAGRPSVPIRVYLNKNRNNFKKIAFFCTMGGSSSSKVFSLMEEIAAQTPTACLELRTKEVKNGMFKEKADAFIKGITI